MTERLRQIFLFMPLWHLLVIALIYYLAYQSFIKLPPRLEEHRKAKYHYVNAGLFSTLALLLFMFALNSLHSHVTVLLRLTTFLTWTWTVVVILLYSDLSVSSRHGGALASIIRPLSIVFIFAAPVIIVCYHNGATGFFQDIDNFAVVLRQGSIHEVVAQPAAKPATNSPVASRALDPASEATSADGQKPGRTWKLSDVPKGLFFFLQAFLVTSYYGKMLLSRYRDGTKASTQNIGAMDQVIFVLSIAFSIWIVFLLLGFDTLSISIFSGLVAIGVSVALRDLLSNYVAGMLLLWDKSVKLNDVISLSSSRIGQVKDITMRYMIVEDRNDVQFLVPHSQLINSTFENWTRQSSRIRLKLDIGVAYGSNTEKVKEIMRSVCYEVPRVLKHPLPVPLILSMDDSAIHFQLRFRIADPDQGIRNVISDVYERLLKRFDEAGIEIPYPQREIRLRRPTKIDPPKIQTATTSEIDSKQGHASGVTIHSAP
jgi:small-conductance mechanosensitive channel